MKTLELRDVNQSATSDHYTLGPVRIRILRSVSQVEEVRNIWVQSQRHPNADIDFYLAVLQSLPGNLRPHVMVAYRDANPVAVLVGRLDDGQMDFKIGYSAFLRPRARVLTFIYGGLLGNPGSETCEMLVREVMKSVRKGEADIAFFNHLRADSPLYAALRRLSGLLSRDYFPAFQIHRQMTIPGSAEQFWQRFSPKVRKNQRWQAKKLVRDHSGKVRIYCYRETSELDCMICDVEQVAKKTYQRGLGVGFVDNPATREQLHIKAEKGWLRTYVLYVSDKPCAFWLGTLYKGTFHSDSMGYDPEYSKYSPGMYLIMQIIEDACNRSEVAAIDFGLGDAQYKEILGNEQWQDVSVYVFGPTLRGLGLNAIRTPVTLIDRTAKKVLEGTTLLSKIKKVWRSCAAPGDHEQQVLDGNPAGPSTQRSEE